MTKRSNPAWDWIWDSYENESTCATVGNTPNHNDYPYLMQDPKLADSRKLVLQSASSVPSEPTRWIFDDWMLAGELTIIAGPPGAGKTTLVCALAAGVSLGRIFELTPKLISPLDEEAAS